MENQPPNNGLIIQNQTENTLQRLSYAMELTKKVLSEGNECPLTMEWWDGLLQYGNLQKEGLEQYNWQHIFIVHLAFWEKGIVLNGDVIGYGKKYYLYGWENCFEVYEQEFNMPFTINLAKITQQQLTKMYEINSFWLCECGIGILEPLQKLKNLQELYCYANEIIDLEPLKELENLQELHCYANEIISLEPLRELKNLQKLFCETNQIRSLKGLQELKNLQELYCGNNQISSLEGLQELKNLQRLDCSENQISSLEIEQFKDNHSNCWVNNNGLPF